jgi:Ni/Fe-hydrogenase subunit HybB-like protein
MEELKPTQMTKKFFTTTMIVVSLLALNGLIFLGVRFIFGIGSISNIDNQYPWGLFKGLLVAAGVALSAGGFTTAAVGHIIHQDKFHSLTRPAILLAVIGYTFAGTSVMIDLGRPLYIWHPIVMWNGSSVLFEVGICVMIYLTVLCIEFLPVVTERFIGRVNLPNGLKIFNKIIDKLLRITDKILGKTMFIYIIAGVVLSCLHQSSLGTLMVIAGPKMHPLWQTPILPLLFLLSAITVGLPMVILISIICSKSFGIKPDMEALSELGSMLGPLLAMYLAFKIGDMMLRQTFVYLAHFNAASILFVLEILIGTVIPLRLFLSRQVLKSPVGLAIASGFVIVGTFMYRMNNFLVAYTPPYQFKTYFPSIGEISVTIGFIALQIFLYRLAITVFPVISVPSAANVKTKYSIRSTVK